ncbi:MAG: endonuclease domain-containing protein [Anaerolineaceae bacterium]|nr:endonuclease domain-containing protein [Anaerolineaceae bacterium]
MSENSNVPFHTPPELWKNLKPLARQMRHEPTPAENALWERLRNRRVARAKFRRQYTIERFIVDFVCVELRLIIEVDGDIHDLQTEYDAARQAFLESQGFCVLRFNNGDVLQSLDAVVTVIGETLVSRAKGLPHP